MQNNTSILLSVLRAQSTQKRLAGLGIIALCLVGLFLTYRVHGNISYILWRRGWLLLTILLVAFASSISTVLFQTLTNNRILSPALMGLETLFILLQTIFVFWQRQLPETWLHCFILFGLETRFLTLFALGLYGMLLHPMQGNLNLILMTGIILSTLFQSTASLLQRILEPNEFAILQGRLFATFTRTMPDMILSFNSYNADCHCDLAPEVEV